MSDFAKVLLGRWKAICDDPSTDRNPEIGFAEIVEFYGSLSDKDKSLANVVLESWVDSDDLFLYSPAESIALEHQVAELLPAFRRRVARLDRQLASARGTESEELVSLIEVDRWLPLKIVEELQDPQLGAERRRLGAAYKRFFTWPDLREPGDHPVMRDAYRRLCDFRGLAKQASCMLGGREFDRSRLVTDSSLRETLMDELENNDSMEARLLVNEYLAYLDMIDELLDAARSISRV